MQEHRAATLSSDPPLPEVDILSLLLGDVRVDGGRRAARPAGRRTAPSRTSLASRSARLLASPISSNVQKVVEQTFGLDSVQITPFFVDPEPADGAVLARRPHHDRQADLRSRLSRPTRAA
ncbi:MAG: translocation/assembly module TamB [Ignavibacteriales bacterium]|nr:translocation/assembly module TamB [Ignavibacteriales bacterium]